MLFVVIIKRWKTLRPSKPGCQTGYLNSTDNTPHRKKGRRPVRLHETPDSEHSPEARTLPRSPPPRRGEGPRHPGVGGAISQGPQRGARCQFDSEDHLEEHVCLRHRFRNPLFCLSLCWDTEVTRTTVIQIWITRAGLCGPSCPWLPCSNVGWNVVEDGRGILNLRIVVLPSLQWLAETQAKT
jgi:hypothetical protein